MILSLIVAASENNIIGVHGSLPWNLPHDLRRFRTLTEGHPVIMGRKTFEAIGRPLPRRTNIVVTRQMSRHMVGCTVMHSLEEAIAHARALGALETFIIGGGEIYKQALPLADRVYLTRVHTEIHGDTFFPELSPKQWQEVSREEHETDGEHPFAFTYILYEKRKE
jgi:dihydrofolate reductase